MRCVERVTWKLTLPCGNGNGITNSQWEFAVWLRKLEQGLGINLKGGDGEVYGREFQKGGDICIPAADSF